MSNIVAIVGRPNVGKSTFYNRLIGSKDAIVDDVSGVTRDRQYGICEWNGKRFTVVDTGGFVKDSSEIFERAIRSQVTIAVEEADAIIFMVDAATGITDLDDDMANMLRRTKKPVFLAVNKVDNHDRLMEANEFWSLGFEETYFIAAISGSATGDILDAITEILPDDEPFETELPKFAIVGQPNVGKSSLTNALLGEQRNIVTDIAGTTRDSIHSTYNKFGKEFVLIDTAGLRKKTKVREDLEFYSVMRAIRAIDESDTCILMIDARDGVTAQDMNILGLIKDRNKGVLIVVNKWDLIEKETNTARDYEKELKDKIAPFKDIPVLFTSVIQKQRIMKVIDLALEVNENRQRKITTSKLNEFIEEIVDHYPPPSHKGRFARIKYATQLPLHYPAFAIFCNNPKYVKASYKQYVENKMRETWNFSGSTITIYFRKSS